MAGEPRVGEQPLPAPRRGSGEVTLERTVGVVGSTRGWKAAHSVSRTQSAAGAARQAGAILGVLGARVKAASQSAGHGRAQCRFCAAIGELRARGRLGAWAARPEAAGRAGS